MIRKINKGIHNKRVLTIASMVLMALIVFLILFLLIPR